MLNQVLRLLYFCICIRRFEPLDVRDELDLDLDLDLIFNFAYAVSLAVTFSIPGREKKGTKRSSKILRIFKPSSGIIPFIVGELGAYLNQSMYKA